jgi:hypothetical protein
MEHRTDRPDSRELKESTSGIRASKDDLFPVVRQHVKPASLARTATELLFWAQYAKHEFRGRKGIYKEDAELGDCLGIHPKTAGKHVLSLCATASENVPGGKLQLFEVAYGPKPAAHSGRVRWLFIRPEGLKILDEALERSRLRRKRVAPTDRKQKFRPRVTHHSDRSPQNAPTLIYNSYLPDKPSGELSIEAAEERELTTSKSEEAQGKMDLEKTVNNAGEQKRNGAGAPEGGMDRQEQVARLVEHWRRVCERSKKPELIWPEQEVDRLSSKLASTVATLRLHEISDADLDARLTVLCTDLRAASRDMSEAFEAYNRHGLELSSFVMYGPKLMKAAAELASKSKLEKRGGKTIEEILGVDAAKAEEKSTLLDEAKVEKKRAPIVQIPGWIRKLPPYVQDEKLRILKSGAPSNAVYVWDENDGEVGDCAKIIGYND